MKHPITRSGQKLSYPWESMKAGDYFDIPQYTLAPTSARGCASARARAHKGELYETSEVTDANGKKVTRIRRIK